MATTHKDPFVASLAAIVLASFIFMLLMAMDESMANSNARQLGIAEPNLVAVSTSNRGVRYAVDTTSNACFIMYTNVLGTTMAPVDCGAIGIDPSSVSSYR